MADHVIVASSAPDPALIVQAARRFEPLYGDHGPHVLRLVNDMADIIERLSSPPAPAEEPKEKRADPEPAGCRKLALA